MNPVYCPLSPPELGYSLEHSRSLPMYEYQGIKKGHIGAFGSCISQLQTFETRLTREYIEHTEHPKVYETPRIQEKPFYYNHPSYFKN